MRTTIIIIILITCFLNSNAELYDADSLILANTEDLIQFSSFVTENSSNEMDFYYENGITKKGERTIRGFLYFSDETFYVKLFYSWDRGDSQMTFKPIPIVNKNIEKKIDRILKNISTYDLVTCYETHERKEPSSNKYPNISENLYWSYRLKYKRNDKYFYVKRDKLSLEENGCNTKKNKLKERKDFNKLKGLINLILIDHNYPTLN